MNLGFFTWISLSLEVEYEFCGDERIPSLYLFRVKHLGGVVAEIPGVNMNLV
jgi:hypothetical protein